MSKPLKPRRGTTAEQNAFVGEAYEVTYDTDKNTLVCRDGVTPGGFPLARADEVAAKDATQDAAIAEALDKVGLPLGFEYTRLTGQNAPLGGVDYMGQTATRAMYADLWAWLNENKPDAIVTEAEWQSLYNSQNGNVAKYSSGDGSTTFRFPRVVGYFKGADAVSKLGEYVKEGLPNLTGWFDYIGHNPAKHSYIGAFDKATVGIMPVTGLASGGSWGEGWGTVLQRFNASLSNPIYGASDHVTPETVVVVMGVIAIGSVASIGEATEEGIVAELGEHGARFSNYLPLSGGTMTGELHVTDQYAIVGSENVQFTGIKSSPSDEATYIALCSTTHESTPNEIVLRPGGADSDAKVRVQTDGRIFFQKFNAHAAFQPTTTTRIGQWVRISSNNNATLTLPAGGTWAYYWHYTGEVQTQGDAGIAAGGHTFASNSYRRSGFAWRIA